MTAEVSRELRASIAILGSMVRQKASNGNIEIMQEIAAARAVCEALVGVEEFRRWEDWLVPRHIAVNAALNGQPPPARR